MPLDWAIRGEKSYTSVSTSPACCVDTAALSPSARNLRSRAALLVGQLILAGCIRGLAAAVSLNVPNTSCGVWSLPNTYLAGVSISGWEALQAEQLPERSSMNSWLVCTLAMMEK